MKIKKYIEYEEILRDELKDRTEAMGYLSEASKDKDPAVFLLALEDVLDAQRTSMKAVRKQKKTQNPKTTSTKTVKKLSSSRKSSSKSLHVRRGKK